jgi:hypothetical protein
LPHFGFEIVSAAAEHPSIAREWRRQRFILAKMIIDNLGHVEKQARFKGYAPVFIELAENIYIEQLAHQQQIGFAAFFLQAWGALKRPDNKAETRRIVWVRMLSRCVDRVLVKSGDLEGADIELSRSRPSDKDREQKTDPVHQDLA